MIASLRAGLDLPQLHLRVGRRVHEHGRKSVRQHVVRAGAGDEIPFVFDHFHCAQVDFLVAAQRRGNGRAGFRKRRRVENDRVVPLVRVVFFAQQVEGVRFDEIDIEVVQRRVFGRLPAGQIGNIDAAP